MSPPSTHPATHAAAKAHGPQVVRRMLDNGLELLIEPLHHAPVVALQAWVHVGAADENKSRAAGLAHLHEHMLFKGTQKRGVGEVARTIEAVGGEMNAWTSFDETVYHLVMGREHGGLGTELLADMVRASIFDPQELSREIEVVKEEIRRAYDSPGRRMSHALFGLAYDRHAYRDPVLGTKESVGATRRADMLAFFHEHYRPDNTTFLIVGDVDVAEATRWVQEAFGSWQAAPKVTAADSTKAARVPEPAPHVVRLKMLAEDVQEASVSLAWPGPAAKDADTPAADLFSVALGHGDSGRLHQALVRPRHLLDAYASCYTPKDPGLLLIGATLAEPHPSREQLLLAVERLAQEAHRLAAEPMGQSELEKARTLVLSDAAYSRETMEGQARKRGFYHGAAGSWQHEETYLAAVRSLDAPAISAAGQKMLSVPPAIVVQIPATGTEDAQGVTAADIEAALCRARGSFVVAARRPRKAALPAPGALDVIKMKLPEGPTVLMQPRPGPIVSMRAIALGGQRLESPDQAGLSLLFASTWGQSSQQTPATELAQALAALGGHVGAFSGRNSVGLTMEALGDKLPETMRYALEVLFAPAFLSDDVARERHAQLERIRSRQDSPAGVAIDLFLRTLFTQHPYGLPSLGTPESVASLDEVSVEGYHGRFVAPERTVISLVGPFDPAWAVDALQQAQSTFGAGAPDTLEQALRLSQPLTTPAREPAITAPRAAQQILAKEQSHVLIGGHGATIADADRYPLAVLASVLSGQSGRLFSDLRDVQSLAYSLSCSSAEGLDPGHVLVHMASSPSKVTRAIAGVRGHLQRMADEPLSADELARARNMLVGGHAIDLQRAGARAMTLATGELYGLGYDHFAKYEGNVRGVTAQDVQRVARDYLAPHKLVEVVVGQTPG